MEKTVEKANLSVQPNKLVRLGNILVATDFSPASDRAIEYALSLARSYESRIIVAHVVSPSTEVIMAPEMAVNNRATAFNAAAEKMGQILISGRLRGVNHETFVGEGPLWPTLERFISKYEADLVVVGTHNVRGLRKVVLGSGAEEIFRQAKCPVLTVGPAFDMQTPNEVQFKNILLATDFGLGAERQAAFAFSLAQEYDANVTLLHVMSHLDDYSELGLSLRTEAVSHELAELVPLGSELWCKPDVRTEIGDPVQRILRVAQEKKADLLVVGAKRTTGVGAGHALSSVAYKLAGAAPCPVLTLRS